MVYEQDHRADGLSDGPLRKGSGSVGLRTGLPGGIPDIDMALVFENGPNGKDAEGRDRKDEGRRQNIW